MCPKGKDMGETSGRWVASVMQSHLREHTSMGRCLQESQGSLRWFLPQVTNSRNKSLQSDTSPGELHPGSSCVTWLSTSGSSWEITLVWKADALLRRKDTSSWGRVKKPLPTHFLLPSPSAPLKQRKVWPPKFPIFQFSAEKTFHLEGQNTKQLPKTNAL